MDNWIQDQHESLRKWLVHTACPMLVSSQDGSILWANPSFEELLGYTSFELIGDKKAGARGVKWTDLTVDPDDLKADLAMVRDLSQGARIEYQLRMSYRAKSGDPVGVIIHVLRWPQQGDVECFLVTAMPIGRGVDFMVGEIATMQKTLSDFVAIKSISWWFHLYSWAGKNKTLAAMLSLFVFVFIFGDRAIEIAESVKKIFGLGSAPS